MNRSLPSQGMLPLGVYYLLGGELPSCATEVKAFLIFFFSDQHRHISFHCYLKRVGYNGRENKIPNESDQD